MTEPTDDKKRIAALIRRMISRVYISSKAMKKHYGLTGPQALVLRTLLGQGSVSVAALADIMYVTPSNLTGILDRLEARGLLERVRSAHDRRVTFLRLTGEGVKLGETVPDPIEARVAAGLARFTQEEVESIRDSLERLVGFMEEIPPAEGGGASGENGHIETGEAKT